MAPKAPRATLAGQEAYAVPEGSRLAFRYVVFTTDGFMRGNVILLDAYGVERGLVACNVPVRGSTRQVQVMGDYARLFPDPIPVVENHKEGASAG